MKNSARETNILNDDPSSGVSLPSMAQRLAMRERPDAAVVSYQRWNHLLFAHWKVKTETVQATLPPGLYADTFEGEAYVGIVPFFMERIRPAWLPPLPWISWFLELNVRTYVHDGAGRPGVWFYSLDCNQPIAVAIARNFFHLPYLRARLAAQRREGAIEYQCERHDRSDPSRAATSRYDWTPGLQASLARPGSLEFFLIERYALFSVNPAGQLFTGRVHHAPYRVHTPNMTTFSNEPARQAGFSFPNQPDSLLGALAVDVSIFALTPVSRRPQTGKISQ